MEVEFFSVSSMTNDDSYNRLGVTEKIEKGQNGNLAAENTEQESCSLLIIKPPH